MFLFSFGILAFGAFKAEEKPIEKQRKKTTLTISIEHFIGNSPLVLDSVVYKNELNQAFTLSRFRYYISSIQLKGVSCPDYVSNDFFLIDEEDSLSKKLVFKDVPIGSYNELRFILGVDSLHNCSGLQNGALDPINGMFWAWNTGYVFLKLEGKSSYSKSPGHLLEYHIGGFRKPANCIRTIQLALPHISLASQKRSLLTIKTDALEVLKNPVAIDFSKLSSVADFHNATTIADNYADIFSVLKVEQEP